MDFNRLKNKSDNFYSQALFVIGWGIIILGTIGSLVIGMSTAGYYGTFNVIFFLIGLLSTALSGFLILGLAEIINILNDNRRLLANIAQEKGTASPETMNSNIIAEELPEL